jgi:small subunit ribosomal protein S20
MAEEPKKGLKVKRPTPLKRELQDKKKRLKNKSFKARLLTAVKVFEKEKTQEGLSSIYSLLDKGQKKGILHENMVSRKKSRLANKLGK